MIYVVLIAAALFLGVGIALAIWVGRLKDQLLEASTKYAELAGRWNLARQEASLAKAEAQNASSMLRALRDEHGKLLQKIEAGALCDARSIADELRLVQPID